MFDDVLAGFCYWNHAFATGRGTQFKMFVGGQPVESISATLVSSDKSGYRVLVEHIFNEKVSTAEVQLPANTKQVRIGKDTKPSKGSFEESLIEAVKRLPKPSTLSQFARALPDRLEVDNDEARVFYPDGSIITYNPLDLYRIGESRDDVLAACAASIMVGGPVALFCAGVIVGVAAVVIYKYATS